MKRRMFLLSGSAALLTRPAFATESSSEITRTEVEWRAMLNEVEYPVMHEEET